MIDERKLLEAFEDMALSWGERHEKESKYRQFDMEEIERVVENQPKIGGWIPVSERMPEEERCIDPETGYYGRSDDVLCSAYDEYEMKYETWIDYTIDGEWQTHEYYEGEKLAWMPLPKPYDSEVEI